MKLPGIMVALALVILSAGCNNQKNGVSALNDPKQQEAILDSISNNPDLLNKVNRKAGTKGMSNMNEMNMMNDSSMMGMMNNNPENDDRNDAYDDGPMCKRYCHVSSDV